VQSFTGLYHHWFRAALSMLGISWGIVSVVVLLAYGDGFQAALNAGFAGAFGDGVAVTMMGQTSKQAGGERAGKRVRLTIADVEAIGSLPLVSDVSPSS
jgi:putative ABC transport system permease protein